MAKRYVIGESGARKLRALLNGCGVPANAPTGAVVSLSHEYPEPYTVRWSQSANDGSGSWIIWLPGDSEILSIDGEVCDPAEDLEAVGGLYPAGWYEIPAAALNRSQGGSLYMVVTGVLDDETDETPESYSVTFASSVSVGVDFQYSFLICRAAVDSTSGARAVIQFVRSSISIFPNGDNVADKYYADEASISLVLQPANGESDTGDTHGHHFHIKGFGRFTVTGMADPCGTYLPPLEDEIEVDSPNATTYAVLCRDGNVATADGNTLAFRKLKIKHSAGSSPFEYVRGTETVEVDGEEVEVITHYIKHNVFYWEGALQSLSDYNCAGVMDSGTVYLIGHQAAPSSNSKNPTWTWQLGTSAGTAAQGGKVLNFKLYDFSGGKVSMDYRTTFLSLEDTTQKAYLKIAKPGDSNNYVEVDSTGTYPVLSIVAGLRSITLDSAILASEQCLAMAIHTLTYTDGEGVQHVVHVLACDDIEIPAAGSSGGGGSGEAAETPNVPWTYDATSGWKNPSFQLGTNTAYQVSNTSQTGDGVYYVQVSFTGNGASAALVKGLAVPANSDTVLNFYVGTVSGGKQTHGIYAMPVCYTYL